MRLASTIWLCLAVSLSGCKKESPNCPTMGVSAILMSAALVRLDVYSGGIGCNGDVIAAGAPAPSQTSVVKEGVAIKLDVPAGRHVLVVSAFADAAATQLVGSACSVVTLKADTPACFNLTLTPPLDLAGLVATPDAATCTQSPDDCPTGFWCGLENHCFPGCRTDADCIGTPTSPKCLVSNHQCVTCLTGSDCPTDQRCSPAGACVNGCDPSSGSMCDANLMCCSELCVNTTNDVDNCGGCGRACVAAGSAGVAATDCAGSVCKPTCDAGFADCTEPAAPAADDGCETNIHTIQHCGGCDTACTLTQATAACPAGTCTIASCNTGFADCNGKASDGCECPKLGDVNGGCCPSGTYAGGCEATHSDGYGHSFIDCDPLGVYDVNDATDAAKAYNATGTISLLSCASPVEKVVCNQFTTGCVCFTYEDDGSNTWVGKARLSATTTCGCPITTSTNVNWK